MPIPILGLGTPNTLIKLLVLEPQSNPVPAPTPETVLSDVPFPRMMRILSLHPAATEIVFAIGAGSQLIGRTDLCDYPESALKVPTIGNPEEVTPEMAAVFEPDLVLIGRDQEFPMPNAKVFRFDPHSIEEIFRQAIDLAELAGKQIEADVVVHDLMSVLEKAKAKSQRFHKLRVYFEVSHSPPKAARCYIEEVIRLCGGIPYTANVTVDDLQEFDPQVIIVSTPEDGGGFDEEIIFARDGWEELNALRYERVFVLPSELFYRPGPRLAEGVRTIARILHGIELNGS